MKLQTFTFQGKEQKVSYIETTENVAPGVDCDVYAFIDDHTKDLGIIKMGPFAKTPAQRIEKGDATIEGYLKGNCTLYVSTNGNVSKFVCSDGTELEMVIRKGSVMQWKNNSDLPAEVYEICFPPYQDGRYTNLPEDIA